MKWQVVVILLVLFASLSFGYLGDGGAKLSQAGVDVNINGPTRVFKNHTVQYEIEVGGSFGLYAQNWSISIEESDKYSVDQYQKQSIKSNTFQLNFTTMKEGKATLNIKGFCSDGEETRYREASLDIKSVEAVSVFVDLKNTKDITMGDLKLGLFIDGKLQNTKIVSTLEPGETKNIQINWSKDGLDEGEHELEVWVDYGYHEDDSFVKDELLVEKTFYIQGENTLYEYAWLMIAAGILGFLGLYYYLNRKKRRRRPW